MNSIIKSSTIFSQRQILKRDVNLLSIVLPIATIVKLYVPAMCHFSLVKHKLLF